MRQEEFDRLLANLDDLLAGQKAIVRKVIDEQQDLEKVVFIIESRILEHPVCPRCQSNNVKRWGRSNNLQRFRCYSCGKTFNPLTGTPLARLRNKDRWLTMANALKQGLPLRRTADECNVSLPTAFLWRHRFLKAASLDKPDNFVALPKLTKPTSLSLSKGATASLGPQRGIVASETPGSPSYWIFPVKSIGDMTTEEIVRTLVEAEKVFAFGPRSFGRRRLRSGDWMCFYASRKGVIAHAQVASEPIQNPLSKVLDPLSYPWTFSVKKVVLYPEKPVPLNPDTRSRLDAFKNRNPDTVKWWNWFVKNPHKISEHDFKVLTRS